MDNNTNSGMPNAQPSGSPNMQSGMQGAVQGQQGGGMLPNIDALTGPSGPRPAGSAGSGMGQMGTGPNMGPNAGPNMAPNMGQPYPQQQMVHTQKQPMDPAKKKRIIVIVSVVSTLLVVGIALAIVLPMVLKVDYSTAYNKAKELKPEIFNIYQSYDCEYVVDYVESAYTSVKSYDGYVEGCKKIYNSDVDNMVDELGNTDGVKRNDEIRMSYEKFKSDYAGLSSGNVEDLNKKLSLWQARHNFVVAVEDLNTDSSDAEFAAAAKYLIDSGNDTLKTYGENWLEWRKSLAAAYREYDNASWSNYSTYQALRDAYQNKKKEYEDWLAVNKPDIHAVAPLEFGNTDTMYSDFGKMYNLIAKTYEVNYNRGSGDCSEFMGEVHCE